MKTPMKTAAMAAMALGMSLLAPAAASAVGPPTKDCPPGHVKARGEGHDRARGNGHHKPDCDEVTSTPQPLECVENETGADTVQRDSAANTVTVIGSGPGSPGSALQCAVSIEVAADQTISFSYTVGEGTAPCGGGVPRMYVLIDGTYYNTFDDDPNECSATVGSLELPVGGTVTEVGFVYDRGDTGSVTYSNAMVGGVVLDI
jgi:hypothetical protein